MTAATTLSSYYTIALGNATVPSSADESNPPRRVALWTDAQPVATASLHIYVTADEFATVWNSPMHLSSFSSSSSSSSPQVQIHVQGTMTSEISSSLQTSLLLAGLVATGERKTHDTVVLQAQKRGTDVRWQAKPLTTSRSTTTTLDENSLLDSHLLAPPPAMSAVASKDDDCSGREPCADCTCGRKEDGAVLLEQQQPITSADVPSSSCGKCNLGDAFRCASCPYLGKPAFKAGEEHLVLELQDDF